MQFCSFNELCKKEIICLPDGKKLGYPSDAEIELCSGRIKCLLVNVKCSLFSGSDAQKIPWCDVERVGQDVIWVCGCFNKKENRYERHNK